MNEFWACAMFSRKLSTSRLSMEKMSTSNNSWEDLRKQARHLENDIDLKLVAFSKLGAGVNTPHGSSDTVPLLSGEHMFDSLALEIQQLLNKLSSINEKMAEQPISGAAMSHTLQRHRDILNELTREFDKTSSLHETRREREELLRSTRGNDSFRQGSDGVNRRDQYLKESQHLHNSDRLINDQISIAMETREHLVNQRQTFKKLQTRFNDLSNRFPAINSLIQRINLRKRRDSVILGIVVGTCTILMLLYAFH